MLQLTSRVAIALVVCVWMIAMIGCMRTPPPAPLNTFLVYPNYRGMMFSDQSEVARVAIEVNPPAGAAMAQLHVVLEVVNPDGKVLFSDRVSPPAHVYSVATID